MKIDKSHMLLYAVTDRSWLGDQTLYQQVEAALKGGVTCLQLREKDLPYEQFLEEAVIIKQLCKEYNVPFIINDNVQIAIDCDADGIHIGQSDMDAGQVRALVGREKIVGVSTSTVQEALKAAQDGADYLGIGAVFATDTKHDAEVVDKAVLKQIRQAVDLPLVAIGGIKQTNISQLKGTGIDGIAVISAIFAADDIEGRCRLLKSSSEAMVK